LLRECDPSDHDERVPRDVSAQGDRSRDLKRLSFGEQAKESEVVYEHEHERDAARRIEVTVPHFCHATQHKKNQRTPGVKLFFSGILAIRARAAHEAPTGLPCTANRVFYIYLLLYIKIVFTKGYKQQKLFLAFWNFS
jgi:hypothetical protein